MRHWERGKNDRLNWLLFLPRNNSSGDVEVRAFCCRITSFRLIRIGFLPREHRTVTDKMNSLMNMARSNQTLKQYRDNSSTISPPSDWSVLDWTKLLTSVFLPSILCRLALFCAFFSFVFPITFLLMFVCGLHCVSASLPPDLNRYLCSSVILRTRWTPSLGKLAVIQLPYLLRKHFREREREREQGRVE